MRLEGKLNVYESIVERIRRDISLGILSEGEKLPSCRDLAFEMGINPNTVQRAYAALEAEGVIYTIPKKGVYIRGAPDRDASADAEEQLRRMKEAGMTRKEIESLLMKIFGGEV